MSSLIISIDPAGHTDTTVFDVCNKSLGDALAGDEKTVILTLPAVMGNGIRLIEWLTDWQQRYVQKGKSFIVIADDPIQQEALEYSHPDLQLCYYLNFDNVPAELLKKDEPVQVAIQPQPVPVYVQVPTPVFEPADQPAEPLPAAKKAEEPSPIREKEVPEQEYHEPEVPDYSPQLGSSFLMSGEYACKSCGTSRMWLKGDKAASCENPECINPQDGWKLTYELF